MFGDDVNRSPQGLGVIHALRLLPARAGTRMGNSLTSNPNTGACKVAIQPIATLLEFHSMGTTKSEKFPDLNNQLALWAKAFDHPARIAIVEFLLKCESCICGDIVMELPLFISTKILTLWINRRNKKNCCLSAAVFLFRLLMINCIDYYLVSASL